MKAQDAESQDRALLKTAPCLNCIFQGLTQSFLYPGGKAWNPNYNTVSALHMNLRVANFQRCERAPVCQLLTWTTVLFKVLYYKILNVFFFVFVFYVAFV